MLKKLLSSIKGLATQYKDVRTAKVAELTAKPQANTTVMPSTLSGSVGRNGKNDAPDVRLVQTLLNRHGAKLTVDGSAGPGTIAAIENFQRTKMNISAPDGRVDPGGRTLTALQSNNTTPVQQQPTQQPVQQQPTQQQAPAQNQGPQSGDYSHPNAKNVKITHGANAVPLNARATALLQSLLAACNIPSANVTSTLRTYHDQARITKTQTLPNSGEATVRQWYGQAVLDATKKYDVAGLAKWWADYDKNRGKLSSLHLSGVALDVVPSKDRAKFADLVRSLTGKNGIRRIIKKGEMNEPVDHVEFTFQVTNQTPTSGSGGGGGGTTTTTTTPPANNNQPANTSGGLRASVGKGATNNEDDARKVQTRLNAHGAKLTVDGKVGNGTIAAIENFQRIKMGIASPDGRVDPNGRTWNALSAAPSGSTTTTPPANTGGTTTPPANTGGTTTPPANNTTTTPPANTGTNNVLKGSVGKGGKNDPADVRLIQQLLANHGPAVAVNGQADAATIKAIEDFQRANFGSADGRVDPGGRSWNALNSVGPKDPRMTKLAKDYNIEVALILAIKSVESRGSGYLPDGRPKILFEGHIFWGELKKAGINPESHVRGNEDILFPKWDKTKYKGNAAEYPRLERAMKIHRTAALKSASWGEFQIMGFNHKTAGYPDVESFVEAMKVPAGTNNLNALLGFLKGNNLLRHVQGNSKDWDAFARGYNGPGYKENNYHNKLRDAYNRFKAQGF